MEHRTVVSCERIEPKNVRTSGVKNKKKKQKKTRNDPDLYIKIKDILR